MILGEIINPDIKVEDNILIILPSISIGVSILILYTNILFSDTIIDGTTTLFSDMIKDMLNLSKRIKFNKNKKEK